jgi:hypothetical protein
MKTDGTNPIQIKLEKYKFMRSAPNLHLAVRRHADPQKLLEITARYLKSGKPHFVKRENGFAFIEDEDSPQKDLSTRGRVKIRLIKVAKPQEFQESPINCRSPTEEEQTVKKAINSPFSFSSPDFTLESSLASLGLQQEPDASLSLHNLSRQQIPTKPIDTVVDYDKLYQQQLLIMKSQIDGRSGSETGSQ